MPVVDTEMTGHSESVTNDSGLSAKVSSAVPTMRPITTAARHAPAKINLALHVTGRRADGYHLLESLVVFTQFGDRISVASADEDRFSVHGPFAAHVPLDKSNLVLRVRDSLRAAFPGQTKTPVAIELEKNLPAASGIGGGSSDAAQTLLALADFWQIDDRNALTAIGLELGADLPMCLLARPLVARGIGERLEPIERFPSLPMVLVNPGMALPTSHVFRALASPDNSPLPLPPSRLDFAALCNWLCSSRNDLEAPAIAIAPAIADALRALAGCGAAVARMSGSGATSFGLFDTKAAADEAASAIAKAHPGWWVVATESMVQEECNARL
jgi:4-diphosphocytidyl-2-C-methyl-D-erythritol kinase